MPRRDRLGDSAGTPQCKSRPVVNIPRPSIATAVKLVTEKPKMVKRFRGFPFVGQVWRHVDKNWRYAVAKLCKKDFHDRHLLRLVSLNGSAAGIHLHGLHTEASLQENNYVRAGFVSPEWIKKVNQAKGIEMPENVKEALRASALKKQKDAADLAAEVAKDQGD